jgi:DNA-directed RNA polymerase specialized sigma24 family protein
MIRNRTAPVSDDSTRVTKAMAIARHKSRQRELREGRALARRVQRGDRGAFALLYASYEGRLFRFCQRLTGSDAAAAALVEATFARALETLGSRPLDSLDVAAHLHSTARSLAYARHANGRPPRLDAAGEHASEVSAANGRLAPRQRMALALRDLEGCPDAEIALVLGAEASAIADLVARARLRLRAELDLPAPVPGCRDRLPELSSYADGMLPGDRRAALEAHVEGCADCRAALFALREAALRYRSLPLPVPPGELSSRMSVALGAASRSASQPAVATADPAVGSGGRQTAVAAAMAALVIVGACVTVVAARDGRGGNRPSRAPAPPPPQPTPGSGDQTARSSAASGEAGARRVALALRAPPALHHLRAGPRRAHHLLVPALPAVGSRASSPASAPSAGTAQPPAAPPAAAPPAPPAVPPATVPEPVRKIPVEILPPIAPPHTPAPADAPPPPPPAPPPPPDPAQTTTA